MGSQEDAPRRSSRQRKPTMRAENIAALSLGILGQEPTKELDETVKSRSQTEKMSERVAKAEDIPQTPNAGSDEEDESSSDSGDDDEAMRKLYLQKLQQAQTLKKS